MLAMLSSLTRSRAILVQNSTSLSSTSVSGGSWEVLVENGGVSAMHMTLTHHNTVVMFDRTDYGKSRLNLPDGRCRNDSRDLALKIDCFAHSIEFDIASNSVRALEVLTDPWCSSGSFLSDGTLLSTGGFNDGNHAVRHFVPCSPGASCDWNESFSGLAAVRWYAGDQILPDGSVIVVGGRRSFSYEFVPSKSSPAAAIAFPFLSQTNVPKVENNLYPFLHLSSDGNLFIFANKQSVLLDYKANRIVQTFPDMPGGGGRNYPSSGSAVMLPLNAADNFQKVEIMICGGAPDGSFLQAPKVQVEALRSCGRMVITDAKPAWVMEDMPMARVMGDMLILPTGEILIINGARTGAAGWTNAANPNFSPVLYRPAAPTRARFTVLANSSIPRLYHSTASVLPDGRVLVGGSNPNVGYEFNVTFPTELRMEAYSPYYLDAALATLRPGAVTLSKTMVGYMDKLQVIFSVATNQSTINLEFRLYAPPFTTHTTSMNQRQLVLAASSLRSLGAGGFSATVSSPPTPIAAPPGYYLLFVLHNVIPSVGSWLRLGS
ncbi:hypothetical protein L7F22_000470 [Adiantum nelumboides]|nr:hypothetical protein [Adiantum nelumboides]